MGKDISFIHVADLHLDSPFQGLSHMPEHIFKEVRESTFVALDRLVRNAIHLQVDFVLIVGDLFDNERQSLKAQIRLRKAFEELEKHHINVYLSYGNHDHINGNIHSVTYPDNVYIFPSEQVSTFTYQKNGIPMVELHGFSYENRAVLTNKTAEYQANQQNALFHIALLHGSLQSNTEHDTYAPFQLSELVHSDFDYWALGHIHQRSILKEDPPIVYSGNTQGRHRKETNKTAEYQANQQNALFHIALLHGSLQSNTEHDTYAPFQLSELVHSDFDYWALGHIHQRSILKEDPPIVYSGNTQGRHRKETGEKGCYHVV